MKAAKSIGALFVMITLLCALLGGTLLTGCKSNTANSETATDSSSTYQQTEDNSEPAEDDTEPSTAPQLQQFDGPAIVVSSATAGAGDTVDLTLTMHNNPGIIALTLSGQYDESAMTLTSVTKGDALSEMTFTVPKNLKSGFKLPWDAEWVEEGTNGTMVTLTFQLSDTVAAGEYVVDVQFIDSIDNDMIPVDFQVVDGKLTIE